MLCFLPSNLSFGLFIFLSNGSKCSLFTKLLMKDIVVGIALIEAGVVYHLTSENFCPRVIDFLQVVMHLLPIKVQRNTMEGQQQLLRTYKWLNRALVKHVNVFLGFQNMKLSEWSMKNFMLWDDNPQIKTGSGLLVKKCFSGNGRSY